MWITDWYNKGENLSSPLLLLALYLIFLLPACRVILHNFGNKLDSFLTFFYPLSFSPKGERFCSFPPGGKPAPLKRGLGWGSLSYQNKLYELTVTFIVKNYTAGRYL
jgi:hypothetical protein